MQHHLGVGIASSIGSVIADVILQGEDVLTCN